MTKLVRRFSSNVQKLKVGFIGAGSVNFGGRVADPWDHATRLEKFTNVEFVGVADLSESTMVNVLSKRDPGRWKNCQKYLSHHDMLREAQPDICFIGLPPFAHGSSEEGKKIELDCVEKGVHLFIEKPVSCASSSEFSSFENQLLTLQKQTGSIISVGYMFRYHQVFRKMKEIIQSHGLPLMALRMQYNAAYSEIPSFWWNVKTAGGTIVEQATHFVDISRYIAGECVPNTLVGSVISSKSPVGDLRNTVHLKATPEEDRVNPVTSATWHTENGTLVNLMHGVTLGGFEYEATVEAWCDGLRIEVLHPYSNKCHMRIRGYHGDQEEKIIEFPDEDPYYEEVKVFLEAIQTKNSDNIESSYKDAGSTFKLTQKIQEVSSANNGLMTN